MESREAPRTGSPLRKLAISLAAVCVAALGGCTHLAPSKPLSELTPTELAGRQVFEANCSRCHYATSTRGKIGPGLEGLFRRPYLKDGEAANDERVKSIILQGHGNMPAFAGQLNSQQLKELLAYLHTL